MMIISSIYPGHGVGFIGFGLGGDDEGWFYVLAWWIQYAHICICMYCLLAACYIAKAMHCGFTFWTNPQCIGYWGQLSQVSIHILYKPYLSPIIHLSASYNPFLEKTF